MHTQLIAHESQGSYPVIICLTVTVKIRRLISQFSHPFSPPEDLSEKYIENN